MIAHSGSTWGYRALLTLLPTEKLGIFIAMTGDDPHYKYRFPLQNYIADHILGKVLVTVRPLVTFSLNIPTPW